MQARRVFVRLSRAKEKFRQTRNAARVRLDQPFLGMLVATICTIICGALWALLWKYNPATGETAKRLVEGVTFLCFQGCGGSLLIATLAFCQWTDRDKSGAAMQGGVELYVWATLACGLLTALTYLVLAI